jgi:adenylate kinase family enzyme
MTEKTLQIQKLREEGGAIILTGPSSCGKEAVSQEILRTLNLKPCNHLSMGTILRNSFDQSKTDKNYQELLARKFSISHELNIYDCQDTTPELTEKVHSHLEGLMAYYKRSDLDKFISQLEWLEYCTVHGLLVPNRWTQVFIQVEIEKVSDSSDKIIIIDGYPRTVQAAKHLLALLSEKNIPIIKIIHLFISKQEMIQRAKKRGRIDDDDVALNNRYNFYVESVQPSVDFMKERLGYKKIALIDGHKPTYFEDGTLNLKTSIKNVTDDCLAAMLS